VPINDVLILGARIDEVIAILSSAVLSEGLAALRASRRQSVAYCR
jgi:hypothetical protein